MDKESDTGNNNSKKSFALEGIASIYTIMMIFTQGGLLMRLQFKLPDLVLQLLYIIPITFMFVIFLLVLYASVYAKSKKMQLDFWISDYIWIICIILLNIKILFITKSIPIMFYGIIGLEIVALFISLYKRYLLKKDRKKGE